LNIKIHKTKIKSIKIDESASLNDLGEGILNVEFHSSKKPKMQPIDSSILKIINFGLDLIEKKSYKGMVLGHQGANFCVGADLNLILELSKNKEWKKLNFMIKSLQETTQRIRFLSGPVIATPFQLTLGGGVEIIQPCTQIIAASETYMGLVEVAVGLIPGGGGNLRMILNALSSNTKTTTFQKIQTIFETIGFSKVSTNAYEAKKLGLMSETDSIVMNKDHLIRKAKTKALELSKGYTAPVYEDNLLLPGKGGKTALDIFLKNLRAQGKISDHDQKIGEMLSHVLTGGKNASLIKPVDEQYILDLEREAFTSLAGEQLTQDRIKYMLHKGKPLRN
jgi:3-hydroxyacyl-CoA dehydrogenase